MYPEKKGGSHKMARPQQNWGLLTLLIRWASIWTMPNTASPKSEPPCGRAVYTPVGATILGHPPQKTAPGGFTKEVNPRLAKRPLVFNGRLANQGLTSLVKEATGSSLLCLLVFSLPIILGTPNYKQFCYNRLVWYILLSVCLRSSRLS